MKRASSLFARTGAICTSLALTLSLFPASAFAADDGFTNKEWNEQSRISVTAPVALIFGADGNGWDKTNNPATNPPKATGVFKNTGDDVVAITAIQYVPVNPDTTSPDMRANSNTDMKDIVKSVTIEETREYGRSQKIEANKDKGEPLESAFILEANGTHNFNTTLNYELELDKSKVKADAFDGGQTSWPIGKIKYVFETSNLWVTDIRNTLPVTYSTSQVKEHALKIARGDTSSIHPQGQTAESAENMYKNFATYPTTGLNATSTNGKSNRDGKKNYICKLKLAGTYKNKVPYDLDIIGVKQDKLAEPSTDPDDVRTYTGITFIFKEILAKMQFTNTTYVSQGWLGSTLKTYMNNPNNQDGSFGAFGTIFEAIGNSRIESVEKVVGWGNAGGNGSYYGDWTTCTNKLFIPSFNELFREKNYFQGNESYHHWETPFDGLGQNRDELYMLFGEQGYWFTMGTSRVSTRGWQYTGTYSVLVKHYDGVECDWWLRTGAPISPCVGYSGSSFIDTAGTIAPSGSSPGENYATQRCTLYKGIAPAFCL